MKFRRQGDQTRLRSYGRDYQRHGRSDGEAGGRRQRSLNRTRAESRGDAEFVAGMRA